MGTSDLKLAWEKLNTKNVWVLVTAFICITQPAGILIGQLTRGWRTQIPNSDSLGNAGKWIGIIERIIILALVLNHQYASVGLLLTAKSLLRFNEPNRLEVKTEYLLIGTLISFGIAALTGIVALQVTGR
jgi:predicted membrane-bound mannosyltransferase